MRLATTLFLIILLAATTARAQEAVLSLDPVAVQSAHGTGSYVTGTAVQVRRGGFVRLGVEVADAGACGDPALLLRDRASGKSMFVPVLSAADGLGVAVAHAEAAGVAGFAESQAATLGGRLDGRVLGQPRGGFGAFSSAITASGSPVFAALLDEEELRGPAMRASLALWLPERFPFGAYGVAFSCNGAVPSDELPLVVAFNASSPVAEEYLADATIRSAALVSKQPVFAGPLDLPFTIESGTQEALETALLLTGGLSLSMRQHPALVAQAFKGRGPIQLTGRANVVAREKLKGIIQFDVRVWNDAGGHFDLWNGSPTDGTLSGRFDPAQPALVVDEPGRRPRTLRGLQGLPSRARNQLGRFTFEDGDPATRSRAESVAVIVDFDDAWQAEDAFLRTGRGRGRLRSGPPAATPPESAAVQATEPWEWSSSTQIYQSFLSGGSGKRARYGQSWVYAGLTTSLLRTVGIPSRPLTNFDSAHERAPHTNRGFSVVTKDEAAQLAFARYRDEEVRAGGDEAGLKGFEASVRAGLAKDGVAIFNFHVWTEAFVSPVNGAAPGWNAYDSTPQEVSESDLIEAEPGAEVAKGALLNDRAAYVGFRGQPIAFAPGKAK